LEFLVPRVPVSVPVSRIAIAALAVMAAHTTEPAFAQRSKPIASTQIAQADWEPPSRARSVQVPAVYAPGSIVVVNNERKLYYITGRGTALQYGVAVGKNAELWMGRTFVAAKQTDPRWIPVNGDDPVEGGDPANPLGKRALYLDWSLLRIHGTPSRGSIGSATSNGCIRMLNEDVVDLFERVHLGAPVYAIKSWKEATRYQSTKVAEKIYVDPEAHRQAQEDLQLQLEELAKSRAEEARLARGLPPSRSTTTTYQASAAPGSQRQSRPQTWGNPSALGR
jgi:lipoprotein-anchoring transpeptidase ErfK/SrfK